LPLTFRSDGSGAPSHWKWPGSHAVGFGETAAEWKFFMEMKALPRHKRW
jgi:hypothetical protein